MITNKRLATIFASALMVFAFALFAHADPAFAEDAPQTTPDVDLSDNGIPVLYINIDPEEYQKVIVKVKRPLEKEIIDN